MSGFVAIENVDDDRLAPFRLHERGLASRSDKRDDAGAGLFLAEGDLVVDRALTAGCRPFRALADDRQVTEAARRIAATGAEVFVGGDEVRALVSGLGMPHPIVALFHRPARPTATELVASADRLVIVEGVDNPANVGAIIRNAAGLGWDGVLLDHTSADPLARRALRVAMGTAFVVPHARTSRLTDVVASITDRPVYALTPDPTATDLRDVRTDGRRALAVGSERTGLSDEILAIATPVRIAMASGVDSLNVAAATAIACHTLG